MTAGPPPGCPAHASPDGRLLPLSAATGCPDPQAVYRRLREEWGNVARVELEPGVPAWLVMGYQELLTITRQEQLFSRDARNWRDLAEGVVSPDSGLLPMMAWRANVIGADGTEHRRLRLPLVDGVRQIDQRQVRRLVQAQCAELIAGFTDRGRADLVTEYAQVVPLLAIGALFGLNTSEGHELLAALRALFGSADDSQAGNRQFEEILAAVLEERRATPSSDLTSAFLAHPDLRDDAEILQSMVVMISAGNETTTTWIAHTLRLMLTDQRFAGRLHGGRLGVDDALDEVLWRDPPMANMPARYALRDTELGGRRIRRGDVLILGLAAANDDPRIHRGDSFAEEVGNRAHLAFSAGPHVCPAQLPARLITRTAVETALRLLSDLRLTIPAEDVAWLPSPWTRCPASLPVTFSARLRPAPLAPAG
ncbi:cytochrome P450 [Streptomyces sp. TP-A0874]|uniref:cytochrome P450 n=1 Tax=Streptomyces sp. TP-A0874 TaxID=549819 RepID=UPI0008531E01|nr:cytochrome P450 [Streptomyces sp. TP-A0874]